jgi:hypothetical protein
MAKLWVTSVMIGVKSKKLHMHLLKPRTCRAIVIIHQKLWTQQEVEDIYTPPVEENTRSIHATALMKSKLTAYKNSNRPLIKCVIFSK